MLSQISRQTRKHDSTKACCRLFELILQWTLRQKVPSAASLCFQWEDLWQIAGWPHEQILHHVTLEKSFDWCMTIWKQLELEHQFDDTFKKSKPESEEPDCSLMLCVYWSLLLISGDGTSQSIPITSVGHLETFLWSFLQFVFLYLRVLWLSLQLMCPQIDEVVPLNCTSLFLFACVCFICRALSSLGHRRFLEIKQPGKHGTEMTCIWWNGAPHRHMSPPAPPPPPQCVWVTAAELQDSYR